MRDRRWFSVFGMVVLAGASALRAEETRPAAAENVVLVLVDGLRCQEVFTGAEEALLTKEAGVADVEGTRKQYWRETPEARREALMPFLWKTMAKEGQLFGNQSKGSAVRVANTFRFSYPGHSEMLVGYADPAINSNDLPGNPNVSVLEWLNSKPRFKGRVAAFGMWAKIGDILNRERCGFYVNGGHMPVNEGKMTPRQELLNELKADMPGYVRRNDYDGMLFQSAMEYFKANEPSVFYVAFDETDEFAHEGRYDDVLDAARRTDRRIGMLWETLQSMPKYRGKTTLILAGDHGRGSGAEWKQHGEKIAGAENVWIGAMGTGVAPLGERSNIEPLTLAQVAATVAAAVGEDYHGAVSKAAPPINLDGGKDGK